MRRIVVVAVLFAALHAAPAAASGTGGARAELLSASGFSVSPASVAPGAPVTFAFQAAGATARVQARVDLLAPGLPAVRARLGLVRAGRALSIAWTPPALAPGRYTARLVVTGRGANAARVYQRATLIVAAPSGVFPVQGPYDFGGADARFGAPRAGHTHQGQDIAAAEGTPIVSPEAGVVRWVAYQADGAGHYVVIHSDAGPDFVFMHLQDGSTLVGVGQRVAAGQRIAAVGNTGESEGPHLHFELWPAGWYSSPASQPVDPLPQLQAWAGVS
jgi:murein DD-endopeptidase MepM/ murein hydrolase activator NlpD